MISSNLLETNSKSIYTEPQVLSDSLVGVGVGVDEVPYPIVTSLSSSEWG